MIFLFYSMKQMRVKWYYCVCVFVCAYNHVSMYICNSKFISSFIFALLNGAKIRLTISIMHRNLV
jgi:hypothetical protein